MSQASGGGFKKTVPTAKKGITIGADRPKPAFQKARPTTSGPKTGAPQIGANKIQKTGKQSIQGSSLSSGAQELSVTHVPPPMPTPKTKTKTPTPPPPPKEKPIDKFKNQLTNKPDSSPDNKPKPNAHANNLMDQMKARMMKRKDAESEQD